MLRYITVERRAPGWVGAADRARVRFERKTSRFDGLAVERRDISPRRCVVLEGATASGKTRALARLAARAREYWQGERLAKAGGIQLLQLTGREALTDWLARASDAGAGADVAGFAKMPIIKKLEVVRAWASGARVRMLLDDVHLIQAGTRKEALALDLLRTVPVWWTTCSDLSRAPQAIRMAAQARSPEMVGLGSAASYDHTVILIWALLAMTAAAGAFEVAGLLSLLLITRRGRGAQSEAK